MKLTYYGTAAAEGWPGVFCRCKACLRARELGGRNIRTRSQACVDDALLIDFPADTYLHVLNYGLDLTRIKNLIITHNHMDHFYPAEFWCRNEGIANDLEPEYEVLYVWGDKAILNGIANRGECSEKRVQFRELPLLTTADIDGYCVTALPADHDQTSGCRIYVISKDNKTLLYAHDTGFPPPEVWEYFEANHLYFDFVSIDDCSGLNSGRRGHMGLDAADEMRQRMIEIGVADSKTIFCLNHFSHNCLTNYDDMQEAVGDRYLISYDGMSVEF